MILARRKMVGTGGNEVEVKKGLSATVGGLVWVQRKNGSWWPGQIVREEELSEIDLAVPRSGTPIKLLARDDTTLDWFDLETTKAVKAFRCGEYTSCIEKAKVSASNNLLKFTKYPRRENAIVCALEIEKACTSKELALSDSWRNGEKEFDESNQLSEETNSLETISTYEEKTNPTQELSHSSISYEETNGSTHIKRKRWALNDSEDDGYEGIKRMKGLNDLGTDFRKKEPLSALKNSIPESSVFVNNSCGFNRTTMGTQANGSSISKLKRKRSQVVHIHELLKREHGRRPITKVLENKTMVPVRIICDEFANPFERSDAISPYYDSEDSDKLRNDELLIGMLPEDDSSDILVDVPYVDSEIHSSGLSPTCQSSFPTKSYVDAFGGDPCQDSQVPASSFGHALLDESGPSYISAGHINQKMEKSASSKWQSKGKRNARHLSKGEEPHSRWKSDVQDRLEPYMIRHENQTRVSPSSNGFVSGSNGVANELPLLQSHFSAHTNFDLTDISSRSGHADSVLYEVEVTVEATRSLGQHVPYISLMSKVNGKPITGHPVTVEALEDGFCGFQSSDYPPSGSCELDDEETEVEVIVEPKSHKKKKKTKRGSHLRRKSKKRHGSSSKKTRKLSSLSGAQKLGLVKSKPMSQTSKGPTLACIPLKVVFSRINEALNGSRSTYHTSNT